MARWTPEEDTLIRRFVIYGTWTVKEVHRTLPGRTFAAVQSRVRELSLRMPSMADLPPSPERIAYLRAFNARSIAERTRK